MSDDCESTTFPAALAAEIARVSALREQYRAVQTQYGSSVNCRPAIALMSAALDEAIGASGTDDMGRQIRALVTLRTFEE